jgi:hypothetical protein
MHAPAPSAANADAPGSMRVVSVSRRVRDRSLPGVMSSGVRGQRFGHEM